MKMKNDFNFRIMNQDEAEAIANQWHYEKPYDFYNFENDPEDYEELMNEECRINYFSVYRGHDLFAFLTYSLVDECYDIGLGIHPDFVSQGYGSSFLEACIEFLNTERTLSLSVAVFNERAIKLYQRLGFIEIDRVLQASNGGNYEFIRMKRSVNGSSEDADFPIIGKYR